MRPPFVALVLVALAGCTSFPELDGSVDPEIEDQPYPALRPMAQIIAVAEAVDTPQEEIREALAQSSEGLGARAEAARQARRDETSVD